MSQAPKMFVNTCCLLAGESNLDGRQAVQLVPHLVLTARTKSKCEGARGEGDIIRAEETFLGPIKVQKCVWLSCRPNVSLLSSRPARSVKQGWWLSQTRDSPMWHGANMAVACWIAHAEAPD